jgi:hypothetical protein
MIRKKERRWTVGKDRGRQVANICEHTKQERYTGLKIESVGRRKEEKMQMRRGGRNKDVGKGEASTVSSRGQKFLGFEAAATARRSSSPASVSTTAITATVDALSVSSAP